MLQLAFIGIRFVVCAADNLLIVAGVIPRGSFRANESFTTFVIWNSEVSHDGVREDYNPMSCGSHDIFESDNKGGYY